MSRSVSKGKRRRSSPVSDGGLSPRRTRSSKKARNTSPARVKGSVLSKLASSSNSEKSAMASFASLVNNARVSAASSETKQGRRSGGSSNSGIAKTSRGTAVETEPPYSIGTIVFIVAGVEPNEVSDPEGSLAFHPAYRLQSDVDISPAALTGMIQSGLAVRRNSGYQFRPTDTFHQCDRIIQDLFPKLFDWVDENGLDDGTESFWLVCQKVPYKKQLMVTSSDKLPTGFDITSASGKPKSAIGERVLYLATREKVPLEVLKRWRPHVLRSPISPVLTQRGAIDGDDGADDTDGDNAGSSTDQGQAMSVQSDSEDEVEGDIIYVSSSDNDPVAFVPPPNAPTPPHVESERDIFSFSMNFDDMENPWH